MATTAIWDVRDNLKRVLNYCANPNKTTNIDFSEYAYQGLDNVLEYTAQDLKTEKQLPETKQSGWTVVHRYLGLFSREEAVEKIIKVHMEAGEKQNDR